MAEIKVVRDKRSDPSYESYDIYTDNKWVAYTTKRESCWTVCVWIPHKGWNWKEVITLPPETSVDDAIATTKTYALLMELK